MHLGVSKSLTRSATIEVSFTIGGHSFVAKRNLLTGQLIQATCDQEPLKGGQYEATLAEMIGDKLDFSSLAQLQSQLLFFGEGRHLLAWDNRLQSDVLSLMLSDQAVYASVRELWDEAKSADSEARNISAQASRLERDLKSLDDSETMPEAQRITRLRELAATRNAHERQLSAIRKEIEKEEETLAKYDRVVAKAHEAFHKDLDRLERKADGDLDEVLLATALTTPTVTSVRFMLEKFFQHPDEQACPCCGRNGLAPIAARLAEIAASEAKSGHCVVCCKDLPLLKEVTRSTATTVERAVNSKAAGLQSSLFEREKTRSRIHGLRGDEISTQNLMAEARAVELKFVEEHPDSLRNPLRITVTELRERQREAERKSSKALRKLKKALSHTNAQFRRIQGSIAKAFKKYASLYLDEPCDVKFLDEQDLPIKKGPQIRAPHAAFVPVVSGQSRMSALALSDAQRSFIDLAFRMAVVEVWHQQTGNMMTMVVETPEGTVDIAYMERVATMLRAFGNQGHTLIVTTNLNNDIFLPELMASRSKVDRPRRILNLLEQGRPRKVQRAHKDRFDRILNLVAQHQLVR